MIAILAYGSLIDDPGPEFKIIDELIVVTPFPVEYARSSGKRGNAPTLVPVENGLKVSARLLVLDPAITITQAKDMLWRRETGKAGTYNPPQKPTPNTVLIDHWDCYSDYSTVLSTRIAPNITSLTAETLADLAIKSALNREIPREENGISYLQRTKTAGVITGLSNDYEAAILQQTGATSLQHALQLTFDMMP